MPATAESEARCAGCGHVLDHRSRSGNVELFPGIVIQLCRGRQYIARQLGLEPWIAGTVAVSALCLRKAREKLAHCPGCGEKGQPPGTLCHACRSAIARSHELESTRSGDLHWYALDLAGFIPYLSSHTGDDPEELRDKFGRLLMRACAAGRYSDRVPNESHLWLGAGGSGGWNGCPAAEMTVDQAAAFKELVELMRPLFALYQHVGVQEGRNILRQMLDGKISPADLDERTERAAKRWAELQGKLAEVTKRKWM